MLYTLIGIVHLVLFLIAAFEILQSGRPLMNKVLWLVVILLLPILGLVAYFLVGRK
ncbi:MAG: PLDc N-terminal domain-containing protein [Phycisphaeraceae bacterium]|nr:PLDc N-terminal domain-containing protein [Phycisphaerae bacterium]MBX3393375.1 PLDc N-terminal domain-containing protein [Phycisphaeraceae bacterium]HRJ49164.1 PLDc N-terminal domain-containing protein [Phycisphaerales bacterium]